MGKKYQKYIGYWLLSVAGMVFFMIIVGGLTRLTHSGLSMVEWRPLMGVLPPLSAGEWQEVFLKYQESPEYQKINVGMSLSDFKRIFWFEYGHRVLGRLIGLVFALPFVFFLFKKAIDRALLPRLIVLFFLGGLQGVIGWWMVKSGLVDNPDVSHYRLTVHLGMAFLLYIALVWTGLSQLRPRAKVVSNGYSRGALILMGMVYVTVLSGGLVAGYDAGYQYNTFPLMEGHVVPPGLFVQEPWYINITENSKTVQFNHRMLAITTAGVCIAFWAMLKSYCVTAAQKWARHALLIAVLLQVTLGIITLLSRVWVPVAASHQSGATLLLTVVTWLTYELTRAKETTNEQTTKSEQHFIKGNAV